MTAARSDAERRLDAHFAYLGWDGHGNLGDDAIREAIEQAFPCALMTPMPTAPLKCARLRLGPRRPVPGARVLIGGGTVIGRANWRLPVSTALRRCPDHPGVMLGAGVEDPSFRGRRSFSGFGELRRWRSVLRKFDRVTVRGPLSAALLADVGVGATVVGDPALLLEPSAPCHAGGDLVVSLGYGDDLWGHDQHRVTTAVAVAVREAAANGLRPRFVAANEADVAALRVVAQGAGFARTPVEIAGSAGEFFRCLDGAAVVLAQRLHVAILAAAAAVPFVMIDYQPKCADFVASVDAQEASVRSDEVTASGLEQLVMSVATNDLLAARVQAAVRRWRVALRAEAERISHL